MTTIPYAEIKSHYDYLTPLIIERSSLRRMNWVSPYTNEVDWIKLFTPIEYDTWNAIRTMGRCPLYPQYPVSKYFLDFGNPHLKIGVECDGKEFHQDKKKDNDRDYDLKKLGWKIYRISGSDIWKKPSDQYFNLDYERPEDRYGILSDFYKHTIDGLIRALAIVFCKYKGIYKDHLVNEVGLAHQCLNDRKSNPVKNWNPQ